MGETATTGTRNFSSVFFIPGKLKIGSILMKGLEGQMITAARAGFDRESVKPSAGAACSMPLKCTPVNTGLHESFTK